MGYYSTGDPKLYQQYTQQSKGTWGTALKFYGLQGLGEGPSSEERGLVARRLVELAERIALLSGQLTRLRVEGRVSNELAEPLRAQLADLLNTTRELTERIQEPQTASGMAAIVGHENTIRARLNAIEESLGGAPRETAVRQSGSTGLLILAGLGVVAVVGMVVWSMGSR